jgi:CRISPR-associated protein Cas6
MGDRLPTDHGYRLYSALVERCPRLKDIDWQLGTINGTPDRNGWIKLGRKSQMLVRCDIADLDAFDLAAKMLRVGQSFLQLREGVGHSIQPHENLQARIVTIKAKYQCRVSEFDFAVALGKQLHQIGIETMPILGNRSTIKVKDTAVVGYGIQFNGLKPEESLKLQRHGLGGRRRMGAGIFYG